MRANTSCRLGVAGAAVVATLSISAAMAEDPYPVDWTRIIESTLSIRSLSVAADAGGGVYIGGTDWDENFPSPPPDSFLMRYDSAGNQAWSKQIATTGGVILNSVAADGSGGVYAAGSTHGPLGGQASTGVYEPFLLRYDAAGDLLWARVFGTGDGDAGLSVASDGAGNAYVCGYTPGDMYGTNQGGFDVFLAKYDCSGDQQWVRQFGGTSFEDCRSVAVDAVGNAYLTGYTMGDLEGSSAGGFDAYLTKYDASGDLQWVRQWGAAATDIGEAVAADSQGFAYVFGQADDVDLFVRKYDGAGNLVWEADVSTAQADVARGIAIDKDGNILLSGRTFGDFDGGGSVWPCNAFLVKLDASGELKWGELWGTQERGESGDAVATDPWGNVYLSGWIAGGNDVADAFLVKYIPEPASVSLLAVGGLVVLRRRRTDRNPLEKKEVI